ncbi:MAG: arginine--tRNA ligase [Bacteroidetes bacterium]|nr:arginine--tRNA ligase [Bacteroidota bacterium]
MTQNGYLQNVVTEALHKTSYDNVELLTFEKPKLEIHGDATTNIAMVLGKKLKKNPRIIAQELISAVTFDPHIVEKIEIAGPGFINFTFTNEFFCNQLREILDAGGNFGKKASGSGKKAQVEYVSANPTGPLSVGHGRQAAIGDTIANLLQWIGYDVTREYYYNNAGRQMRVLAESTYARYRQLFDPSFPFPEDGYQGDYIRTIAEELKQERGDSLLAMNNDDALAICKAFAEEKLFTSIRTVLAKMRVHHDVFYNEDSLYKEGKIQEVVDELRKKNLVYEKDGALWFKATELGLEQDRVIVKSTGEPTYRLPDIAYHREKFRRGFDLIVDIFGADHIATFPDVLAALKALGYDADKVKVVIHQFVTLLRDGEQVKMSKRLANFVTLDELIDEVGPDAVRFFFLMRSISSHLEFDLDLAKEQSEKNPVYYVQYAHARIASIIRFAQREGMSLDTKGIEYSLLTLPSEVALIKLLLNFPDVVESTALAFEPHRITTYLHDVAEAFHKFYQESRVVIQDKKLSSARLALCTATKIVIANGCSILGVTAPEQM